MVRIAADWSEFGGRLGGNMRFVVTLVLATLSVGPAEAAAPCYRPAPPSCAFGADAFPDRTVLTTCHREVETYLTEMIAYLECRSAEHADATREMQEVVRLFNCRLAGGGPCSSQAEPPPDR